MIQGSALNESLVGAVLSRRFRLTEELGRGGMGAVYAGTPLAGGPPVAIKILHPPFIGDDEVRSRFLEEGRTCMRLLAPNILRVHEVLTAEDGSPYLVMDLLEGVPLAAYTRNGGRIQVAHAVPILQGMLAGLTAAHEQGVVHRDLKPGNVFLSREDGGLFIVKLLDFGIAKVMDAAGGMGTRTRTGMLLGTPAYMSPEQIRNAKDVDARADLWSAGVMFYEMLTGRAAFPAPTEYARLSAVLQTSPDPIASIDHELAPFGAFVDRAMQKDRASRFQSARAMAHALSLVPFGRGEPQGAHAALSRLPDQAWIDEPAASSTAPYAATVSRGASSRPPPPGAGGAPVHSVPLAQIPFTAAALEDAATRLEPVRAPGGTLASPSPRGSAPPLTPKPAEIVVVKGGKDRKSLSGTMSSEAPRARARTLIAMSTTLALVVLALAVGILVGYAIPHPR